MKPPKKSTMGGSVLIFMAGDDLPASPSWQGNRLAMSAGYDTALAPGIRSRTVDVGTGLAMHVLEAGFGFDRPCVLLLHGFPELAYSWRKVMPVLADAGFHVLAPDQRGYGRTLGSDDQYDGDLASFHILNLAKDILGLTAALGIGRVAAVVGHDFGSPVAAWCALLHPEVFRSVVLLSAPFSGAPRPHAPGTPSPMTAIPASLAALSPPRKHYQWYYSTREANADMHGCAQGLHAFLRAYYHCKSADWQNTPFALVSWAADELAKMPKYYIMDLDSGMAETVAEMAPTAAEVSACLWLPDEELRVYSGEFARRSFQGGLQWYRSMLDPHAAAPLQEFSGRRIDVPCCYIAGKSDWGTHQSPGALQAMSSSACSQFRGMHLIDGAGHWVQQEQPAAVSALLIKFLERAV
jgi:pimeloyl-ACP methyl ester carboxylesterase